MLPHVWRTICVGNRTLCKYLVGVGENMPDFISRKGHPTSTKNIYGIFIPKCSKGNVYYNLSNIMLFSIEGNLLFPSQEE